MCGPWTNSITPGICDYLTPGTTPDQFSQELLFNRSQVTCAWRSTALERRSPDTPIATRPELPHACLSGEEEFLSGIPVESY